MKEALPSSDIVQKLLSGLLGRTVTAKKGAALAVGPQQPVAVYACGEVSLALFCICDLYLASYAGAALTLIPPDIATGAAKSGKITGEMWENFREVLNVSANMFNREGVRHVSLRVVHMPPAAIPAEVTAILAHPAARVDLDITITGYGPGKMSFFSAA